MKIKGNNTPIQGKKNFFASKKEQIKIWINILLGETILYIILNIPTIIELLPIKKDYIKEIDKKYREEALQYMNVANSKVNEYLIEKYGFSASIQDTVPGTVNVSDNFFTTTIFDDCVYLKMKYNTKYFWCRYDVLLDNFSDNYQEKDIYKYYKKMLYNNTKVHEYISSIRYGYRNTEISQDCKNLTTEFFKNDVLKDENIFFYATYIGNIDMSIIDRIRLKKIGFKNIILINYWSLEDYNLSYGYNSSPSTDKLYPYIFNYPHIKEYIFDDSYRKINFSVQDEFLICDAFKSDNFSYTITKNSKQINIKDWLDLYIKNNFSQNNSYNYSLEKVKKLYNSSTITSFYTLDSTSEYSNRFYIYLPKEKSSDSPHILFKDLNEEIYIDSYNYDVSNCKDYWCISVEIPNCDFVFISK